MTRLITAASVLLLSSATAMAGLITQPANVDPTAELPIDSPIESLFRASRTQAPDFGSLSDEQKHALMLVSAQNGQIDAAIAIAEMLAVSRKQDVSVRALRAGRQIQRYQLPDAEAQLKALAPKEKFEIANVELMWALLEASRDDDRKALERIDKVLAQLPDHPFAHNVKGVLLTSLKRFDEARRAFARALEHIPKMDGAEANWGFVELQDGKTAEATRHFDRAIAINPQNCQARFGKALLLRGQGNPAVALETLGSCGANSSDLGIRMLAAESMLDLGRNAEALDSLRRTTGLDADPQGKLLMAKAALRNGDADAALRYANGTEPQAQYYKAVALLAKGDATSAQRTLQPMLKSAQAPANARLLDAIVKLQLKQPLAAPDIQRIAQNRSLAPFASLLSARVATDPKMAVSDFRSAASLMQGGDFTTVSAESITKQVQSAQMQDVIVALFFDLMSMQGSADRHLAKTEASNDGFLTQYLLGMRAFEASQNDAAIARLRKSLQIDARYFPAQFLLAEALLRANQPGPSLAEYEKALAIKLEPGAALKAGVLAERLGKLDVAEKHLRAVVQAAPDNFIGYNQLAWFLASHDRKVDEAVLLATKATQLAPNDANTLDTLGWALFMRGQYGSSVSTFQRASQLSGGKNAGILFHLAMAESKAGNSKGALDNAQKAKAIGVPPQYSAPLDKLLRELGAK
jgi:tetratricopeptide (TPR) repeat protein